MKRLNSHFEVPSVRKPPPLDRASQITMGKVSEDLHGAKGVGTLNTELALEGHAIPRYIQMFDFSFIVLIELQC